MATNRSNGKEYIGKTIGSLEKRRSSHILDALGKRNNMYFGRAIRKHSPENFDWEILHTCNNINDLNKLEIYYIKLYDTFNNGYNLTEGGDGGILGFKHSEESKLKMSKSHEGYRWSERSKQKTAATHKGKKLTKEHCLNIALSKMGSKNPFFEKKHSEESKNSISETLKGKYVGKKHSHPRPIVINNTYYDTIIEASNSLEIPASTIRYRLKVSSAGYRDNKE